MFTNNAKNKILMQTIIDPQLISEQAKIIARV